MKVGDFNVRKVKDGFQDFFLKEFCLSIRPTAVATDQLSKI